MFLAYLIFAYNAYILTYLLILKSMILTSWQMLAQMITWLQCLQSVLLTIMILLPAFIFRATMFICLQSIYLYSTIWGSYCSSFFSSSSFLTSSSQFSKTAFNAFETYSNTNFIGATNWLVHNQLFWSGTFLTKRTALTLCVSSSLWLSGAFRDHKSFSPF